MSESQLFNRIVELQHEDQEIPRTSALLVVHLQPCTLTAEKCRKTLGTYILDYRRDKEIFKLR